MNSRLVVWLSRIPRRRGFGVQSPFAFDLITDVIYQRTPYYAYDALRKAEKQLASQKDKQWLYERLWVKRLLFRLANEVKANTIVDVGTLAASSLYLKAARVHADYTSASSLDDLFLEAGRPVDFLYLHDYRHPDMMEEAFRVCAPRATSRSLFVIEGIGRSKPMKQLWKQMQDDPRVGVTFDLYDVGLLFFDTSLHKQHYVC